MATVNDGGELTYSDNGELLRLASEGDNEAVEKLVLLNMGLVKSIAARFRDRGVEYEDLVQIGTVGMLKAVRCFDFSYNTVFSTYAVPLIIGEIKRFLRDDGLVKVGRGLKKQGLDISRKRESFIREHKREPRVTELSEICGMTSEELMLALDAVGPVRSLDEPVGDDDSLTLEGTIADGTDRVEQLTDRIALSEAIAGLEPLQRKIVALRYFRDLSQQQTGDILGISQVKVSREEKKIMTALRQSL